MVFWSRIRPSKLQCLSNQCKRWYTLIPGDSSSVNSIAGLTRTSGFIISRSTDSFNQWRPREAVRFFGVQSKHKPEKKGQTRLNDQITGQFVRLVADDGHEIVSRHEALERARKLNLDLVEVQRTANPPVCKIMDFHREKYKQQLKEKDREKSKSVTTLRKGDCKEVRFKAKTEARDLQMKADMVKRLMDKGYRVKCVVMGENQRPKKDPEEQEEQERIYKEFLLEQLSRLTDLVEEVSVIESAPKAEKRQAFLIVRHVKFGNTKKGPGKKAAPVSESSSTEVQQKVINSSKPIQSPQDIQGEWKLAPNSDLESDAGLDEEEALSDTSEEINDERQTQKTWSTKKIEDNDEKVFDISSATASISTTDSRSQSPVQPLQQQTNATASFPVRVVPEDSSFRNMKQPPIAETVKRRPPQFTSPPQRPSQPVTPSPQRPSQVTHTPQRQPSQPVTPSPKRPQFTPSHQRRPSQPVTPSPQQPPSQPVSPSATPKSYGIFSSQIPSATHEQNAASETHREVKEGNSSGTPKSTSSTGTTSVSAENKQNAGSDTSRQEDWGVFSRKGALESRTPAQR